MMSEPAQESHGLLSEDEDEFEELFKPRVDKPKSEDAGTIVFFHVNVSAVFPHLVMWEPRFTAKC